MKKRAPATRVRIGMRAIACILALAACPEVVTGSIPPSQFHFKNVVRQKPPGKPGGWKAAQVIITLGDRYVAVPCQIEVGVPEQNENEVLTDELAQVSASAAADQAARIVLGQGPTLSAVRCRQFIDEMNLLLKRAIPGSKVTPFSISGLQ